MVSGTLGGRMKLADLLKVLREAPLVPSVQADSGSPLDHPETIVRLARASLSVQFSLLRLQGVEDILAVRQSCPGVPIAGLIKSEISRQRVYITPGIREVQALIDVGCEIVCLDGTSRPRPGGTSLEDLIHMIHAAGRVALADIDSLSSAN